MALGFMRPWLVDDVVEAWHIYRTPIILLTLAVLLVFRTILHSRSSREPISASPLPSSPNLKPAIEKPEEKVLKEKEVIDKPVKPAGPKRVVGRVTARKASEEQVILGSQKIQVLVFFSSLTGSTERTAKNFVERLSQASRKNDQLRKFAILEPRIHDLSEIDYDEFFINPPKPTDGTPDVRYFYLFLVPTYNIDSILDIFIEHLKETHNDFRIDTAPLSPLLGYSVFGFGDREGWPTEEDGFCSQARDIDKWMAKLTARKRAFPLGMGDTKSDAILRLEEWRAGVEDVLENLARTGSLGEGVTGSGDAVESDDEDIESDDGEVVFDDEKSASRPLKSKSKSNMDDLEDLGRIMRTTQEKTGGSNLPIDFTTYGKKQTPVPTTKEMVPKSSPTYASLTKQGYTIVGSHSGVKICRWTKSALRGRGSCYKFSFYGIASHQCMETTPSLSCSNKCVFCWRHGTNPVGTTWRWVVDPPDMIFNGVKEGHYKKIKMMRGVPGVRAERFAEAMRIRHCALSLVGEPIFYPHINEFTAMLHAEHISSFLVCNAQHPDQLAALRPVTQLYVSIDASNKESLKKIDRPLHRDFWERFQRCLDILREARFRQRTVFRLTLVKGFNIEDEVTGYADLVEKGLPCFVEVKGVTYCGTASSAGAGLTMQNVPFYEEVCTFVEALSAELQKRNLGYGIAAEHAHSCCILIASERFRVNDKWHTRIGYEKFFQCLESGKPFSPEDYMGDETPEWATWGNEFRKWMVRNKVALVSCQFFKLAPNIIKYGVDKQTCLPLLLLLNLGLRHRCYSRRLARSEATSSIASHVDRTTLILQQRSHQHQPTTTTTTTMSFSSHQALQEAVSSPAPENQSRRHRRNRHAPTLAIPASPAPLSSPPRSVLPRPSPVLLDDEFSVLEGVEGLSIDDVNELSPKRRAERLLQDSFEDLSSPIDNTNNLTNTTTRDRATQTSAYMMPSRSITPKQEDKFPADPASTPTHREPFPRSITSPFDLNIPPYNPTRRQSPKKSPSMGSSTTAATSSPTSPDNSTILVPSNKPIDFANINFSALSPTEAVHILFNPPYPNPNHPTVKLVLAIHLEAIEWGNEFEKNPRDEGKLQEKKDKLRELGSRIHGGNVESVSRELVHWMTKNGFMAIGQAIPDL